MSVRRLSGEEADVATDVLCEAFYDYPVMRWVLQAPPPEYPRRLERLVGFFVAARVLRDEPLLAVDGAEGVEAVAMLSYTDGPPSPPELSGVRSRVWAELGPEARARYEAFGAAFGPLIVPGPHVHLNMIGTRRTARGRGHSRTLLEWVHAHSASRPGSTGVSLTTEDPGNVPLYEHFGYAVRGRARISDDIETWVFFRPDDG